MTVLLKHRPRKPVSVRPALFQSTGNASISDSAADVVVEDRTKADLSAAYARISEFELEVTRLEASAKQAFLDGQAAGRQSGKREAEDLQAERVARLEAGVAEALTNFGRQLAGLEALAGDLAKDGLERIFGDRALHSELLRDALRHHLDGLERRALVDVEVSAADFPDQMALDTLIEALGRPELQLSASRQLESGDCLINLRLGSVEAGAGQQWRRLKTALSALSLDDVE